MEEKSGKDDRQHQGVLNLAIDCCVWPSKEVRAQVLKDIPGAYQLLGTELVALGRGGAAERSKKYKPATPKPDAASSQ